MNRFSIFTKDLLKEHLAEIISEVSDFEFNNWKEENYLVDLPEKWKLSLGVFTDEILTGFSFNSLKTDIFYIHFFYIFKGFRKSGIGNELLSNCERVSAESGIKIMQLKCRKNNTSALNFYIENKFHIKGISPQNNSFYLMEKKLF